MLDICARFVVEVQSATDSMFDGRRRHVLARLRKIRHGVCQHPRSEVHPLGGLMHKSLVQVLEIMFFFFENKYIAILSVFSDSEF